MSANKLKRIEEFVGGVIKDCNKLDKNSDLSKQGKALRIMAKAIKEILDE